MSRAQTILGPMLNPRAGGKVDFYPDGALLCDAAGIITFIGNAGDLRPPLASSRKADGFIVPPFLDAHIHVPQHPIRGHFMDGVGENPEQGRLLAGLNRNVFPAEAKFADVEYARRAVEEFGRDTLSQGVVGGAAYLTVHRDASQVALASLGEFWRAGLVLMEMNCPEYLRVDSARVVAEMRALAERFGRRYIVTDRFAVAVGSDLRKQAARLARDLGLTTQTHLNEQVREKQFVEQVLYPGRGTYTDVYRDDGLLDVPAILAHCIHMTTSEYEILARQNAFVAHCPTSNTLLCSGIMSLDEMTARGIEYAICTDVGASPTTSMLGEMAQFLKVHAGRSSRATPSEALYRGTLAPALRLGVPTGTFGVGSPMSFIEVAADGENFTSADDAIGRGLLEYSPPDREMRRALDELQACRLDCGRELDVLEADVRATAARLERKVLRVTLAGQTVWSRAAGAAV